ncbi:MAG: phosphatidate cytidylyltransferase [Gammaproteobacteria bacterium]|nr:phosphatidate cytidylyltransferase [Gammaproteobacteria bacterium]
MLWQRILTGIPLAVVAIWFILSQSTDALFYALLTVSAVAAWEWSRLSGISNLLLRSIYTLVILAVIYVSYPFVLQQQLIFNAIIIVALIWWSSVIYRMSTRGPGAPSEETSLVKALLGFIALVPAILALLYIHQKYQGAYWMLYSLSIIWIADIGAYFSGRKFGKNKLAPTISPGKTLEGMYGALIATTIYTMAATVFFNLDVIQTVLLLVVAFFATLLSIAGDLYISLLKRERGVKDSGAILPGHGGVLDRIDSITSSAPFFALLLDLIVFNV